MGAGSVWLGWAAVPGRPARDGAPAPVGSGSRAPGGPRCSRPAGEWQRGLARRGALFCPAAEGRGPDLRFPRFSSPLPSCPSCGEVPWGPALPAGSFCQRPRQATGTATPSFAAHSLSAPSRAARGAASWPRGHRPECGFRDRQASRSARVQATSGTGLGL